MEPDLLIALLKAETAKIETARDEETDARNALAGDLGGELKLLFPTVSRQFLNSNGNFANEMQRGADEITEAITGAALNWTGPVKDAGVERFFTPDLLTLMATDALVTGKLCLYPRINADGEFVIEAPAGYLHPIFDEDDDLRVVEVLQVVFRPGKQKYQVTRYSRGMIEVYPLVSVWTNFMDGTPKQWPQPHAADRLPIAFSIIRRDANRRPQGIVAAALPAFRRYMKTAVNRNAVQEIAGFPERVVKSDRYLSLYLGITPQGMKGSAPTGLQHPAIAQLLNVGPYEVKILGKDDVYEIMTPADPKPHIDAEQTDKQALLDALKSADLSGGNATGVALETRNTKARNAVRALCAQIAATITNACALASGIKGSEIGEGIKVSITPLFPVDTSGRVTQAADLFSKGGITKSMLWLELVSAQWNSITDTDIERQQQIEEGVYVPTSLRSDAEAPAEAEVQA